MSCKVKIEGTSFTYDQDAGESILEAALAQGIPFPHACKNGLCGTCKARVLKGEWEYLDGYEGAALTRKEIAEGFLVSCKASARSNISIQWMEPVREQHDERTLEASVSSIELLCPGIARLVLDIGPDHGFNYRPGQYVDFVLEGGRRRPYSIASSVIENNTLDFHIRHVPGGYFTERLFSGMAAGDKLTVEGPKGNFGLDEYANRPMIFVAGGTGFAPIKSMLERLFQTASRQEIVLYRGAESREALYMDGLIRSWEDAYPFFNYRPVISGSLPAAIARQHNDLSDFDIYLAGPPAMIEQAKEIFPAYKHPQDRFFSDAFIYQIPGMEKNKRSILQRLFARG